MDADRKRVQILFNMLIKTLTLYTQGKMNASLIRFEQNVSIFEHILNTTTAEMSSKLFKCFILNMSLFGRTEYSVPYRSGFPLKFELRNMKIIKVSSMTKLANICLHFSLSYLSLRFYVVYELYVLHEIVILKHRHSNGFTRLFNPASPLNRPCFIHMKIIRPMETPARHTSLEIQQRWNVTSYSSYHQSDLPIYICLLCSKLVILHFCTTYRELSCIRYSCITSPSPRLPPSITDFLLLDL